MLGQPHLETVTIAADEGRYPMPCATPGCRHRVNERWDESGLLCADCVIEGELFDRDCRWDHVSVIPGTHQLPS